MWLYGVPTLSSYPYLWELASSTWLPTSTADSSGFLPGSLDMRSFAPDLLSILRMLEYESANRSCR